MALKHQKNTPRHRIRRETTSGAHERFSVLQASLSAQCDMDTNTAAVSGLLLCRQDVHNHHGHIHPLRTRLTPRQSVHDHAHLGAALAADPSLERAAAKLLPSFTFITPAASKYFQAGQDPPSLRISLSTSRVEDPKHAT